MNRIKPVNLISLNTNELQKGEEGQLFGRIAAADAGAFSEVYQLYKVRLLYYALHLGVDWSAAEDVLSEAFLALWRYRQKLQSDDHIRNFLYQAVRHQVIKVVHGQQQQAAYLATIAEATPEQMTPGGPEVGAELLELIVTAAKSLPDEYRRIYELAFEQEFSPTDIAKILEKNPSTIRTQKQRALDMIREWIQERSGTNPLLSGPIGLILYFFEFFFYFLRR